MEQRTLLLGVTGSIAAYKAVEIARDLERRGVHVRVLMTEAATRFIAPLTFEALLKRPVTTSLWESRQSGPIPHIALSESADALLVAPASADIIAKLAGGMADDIVSCTALAFNGPLLVAPAMHANMYEHVATQANLATLRGRGAVIIGPETGELASGGHGAGRMSEPATIVGWTMKTLGRKGDFAGRTVVVTAGGTQEPIDPVRCVTNHSSGKMGYAIAEACRDRGADVILVTAPTGLQPPVGVETVNVVTAQQMYEATRAAVREAHALIMAAAVADYRPSNPAADKIKKERETLVIPLERTVDILKSIEGDFIRVGFAAESSSLEHNARAKLAEKHLDLIAANDITASDAGFGSDNNRVTIMDRDGGIDRLPLLSKREVADRLLDRVAKLLS
ncbi:MAG: bifunctional phosphopantothenoylcysteine decarboxylase/phosphopantothenate--cysteine ligase CoaBC [Dehalococcoidia bacterium]|jgi:phosphopantothenoylcysteine decarboxylase/phosphopantothenate--cysteine ligase|nr:bifunctional phosphopantothenoylcysteine decarboxylase/phosphopantothenate--cysteine ligase CoaBC [Dehalococcoidia bacterium]